MIVVYKDQIVMIKCSLILRDDIEIVDAYRIMKVDYKERKDFEVYIRKSDLDNPLYLCTISKVVKPRSSSPLISSRICSKVMEETKWN